MSAWTSLKKACCVLFMWRAGKRALKTANPGKTRLRCEARQKLVPHVQGDLGFLSSRSSFHIEIWSNVQSSPSVMFIAHNSAQETLFSSTVGFFPPPRLLRWRGAKKNTSKPLLLIGCVCVYVCVSLCSEAVIKYLTSQMVITRRDVSLWALR